MLNNGSSLLSNIFMILSFQAIIESEEEVTINRKKLGLFFLKLDILGDYTAICNTKDIIVWIVSHSLPNSLFFCKLRKLSIF